MSKSPCVVVIVAPQGAGKTHHAEKLRELFGCTCVVDEWDGASAVPAGALVLALPECAGVSPQVA